ncbi:MAG: hypothetical protein AB1894_15670 [Chloroflexota bacterium]
MRIRKALAILKRAVMWVLVCLLLVSNSVRAAPAPGSAMEEEVFIPLVSYIFSANLPAQVQLSLLPLKSSGVKSSSSLAADAVVPAGTTVLITATTRDEFGDPTYFASLELSAQVSGRSGTLADEIELLSHGDGVYTGDFAPTVSGDYYLSALGYIESAPDKWAETDEALLTVTPLPVSLVELSGSHHGPVHLLGRDEYLNPVPDPNPLDYACVSSDPDIEVGPLLPDPQQPFYSLAADISASAYAVADITCTHLPSGANDVMGVGYAPLILEKRTALGEPGEGFPAESFFDVFTEVQVPYGQPGWKTLSGQIEYTKDSGIVFDGCHATSGAFLVTCTLDETPALVNHIDFTVAYQPPGAATGELEPFKITFNTPAVSDTSNSNLVVNSFHLYEEPPGGEILYPSVFNDAAWNWFPFSIKPLKFLFMHIYIVQGSATQAQVDADVAKAQENFDKNAESCSLPFYVHFIVIITWIPAADWGKIDTDHDGLDRYDRNKDGDYNDKGDNDDLNEAKKLGYYDSGAATENVYYVPSIRGGALGTTYAPNGQVAVDNSKDHDNQTLFHEKVHEMDLRKDGDFDVKDSPADPTNAQGARNPGNAMNYNNMGGDLTPTQGAELDP